MDKNDKGDPSRRGEDFLNIFKKGAEFTQELLQENERLRYRIVQLEQQNAGITDSLTRGGAKGDSEIARENRDLREQLDRARQELNALLERFREVEEENKDFAARYVEVEEENNNLANLYISSYQLHSTLDFKEVLQIILEIVINLIGAEVFSVMLLDEKTRQLTTVAAEGAETKDFPPVKLGEGTIGETARSGENYFVSQIDESKPFDPREPIVCIPLAIKDNVIGVICIYRLLEQKSQFANVDYELFTLLAGHAATAIFSAKLYSDSERKLNTIQGFLNLLTK